MQDRVNADIKRFLEAGLSERYIANYLGIEISRVERAARGEYAPAPPRTFKQMEMRLRYRRVVTKPSPRELTPVTRPFPDLLGLNDSERIIALTLHGISAEKIKRYVAPTITVSQINAHARLKLGPARKGNNSREHHIDSSFMPIIHECLKRLGKDRHRCELCLDPVPEGCTVHHTKYEGATVYDLMYICQSCNLARENKGLQ